MAALAADFFKEWEYEQDQRVFDDTPAVNDPLFNPTVAEVPYTPRPQFLPFHNRKQRWSALVCHRRAGKTVACIAELVHRALYTSKKNARYAYVAPFFRQAKDVAWTYLKEMTEGFATDIRVSELRVVLPNGAFITLYGADNPDALRGLYLDGVILDEYGDCRPNLWAEVILPTLMDRRGFAVFIGTPKGKNDFFTRVKQSRESPKWFDLTLKASESGLLDPEDLQEMRDQMTEDEYAQEMECSFDAAVLGAYYASTLYEQVELKGHIRQLPHDPDFPVQVAMDLGFTDSTAIWFWQERPDGVAMIDYEECHSQALQYYFDMMHDKPYTYGTINLPHDARARSLQTGLSTIEQFLQQGFTCNIVTQLKLQEGIDAARKILPSCYFDDEKTKLGRDALQMYRRRYDDLNKCFSDKPLHDWSSHGADAFRYFALSVKEAPLASTPPKLAEIAQRGSQELLKRPEVRLNELWSARDAELSQRRRGQRI
jgi:hypothetical protein